MESPIKSQKGQELLEHYKNMAQEGYQRGANLKGIEGEKAFNKFGIRKFKKDFKEIFNNYSIKSLLDYGAGRSNWNASGFDEASNKSASQYFDIPNVYHYEPARGIDQRRKVDCVICFDVLEHIFISDVPNTLRDIISLGSKLIILNIAYYKSDAKLPNGENAHITIRPPLWWKGVLDTISIEYPSTTICLACSKDIFNCEAFRLWNANEWLETKTYSTRIK